MSDRIVLAPALLIVGVPAAFSLDHNRWRKRSRESLEGILAARDWARVGTALKELTRRGDDIAKHIPVVLELMMADSASVRAAGKLALRDHFPEVAREIPQSEATGDATSPLELAAK